jgi:hypothetical protein
VTLSTDHYLIQSSATADQTKEIGAVVETLYASYAAVLQDLPKSVPPQGRLRLKLFKDRREFRRCNRGLGWAEAFYRQPFCYAYYSAVEVNPYHWMLHEAAHQLNQEVGQLKVPQWIDEGLAAYFSTSRLKDGVLYPGEIDRNTYPIWWLDDMDLSGDLTKDIAAKEIIPLRALLSGRGGPDLDRHFNLYYLHWWSLSHFLFHFEGAKYRPAYLRVIREGGSMASFEKNIGPLERIQTEWYRHLQEQKKSLKALPPKQGGRKAAATNRAPVSSIETRAQESHPSP